MLALSIILFILDLTKQSETCFVAIEQASSAFLLMSGILYLSEKYCSVKISFKAKILHISWIL